MAGYIISDNGTLQVPDNPIIPYIQGDGIGPEVSEIGRKVIDAAVEAAYGSEKAIEWKELYAGGKSVEQYGNNVWLPDETIEEIQRAKAAIKGPLMTPVGGGIRSLNVAMRQRMDLFVCQRPVRWFAGVPSPMKHPDRVDMVVFRENTEDIYAGIEWELGSDEVRKVINFLQDTMGVTSIRFPETSAIGIKPVSIEGSRRLIRSAIDYAIQNDRKSVTLVHKGNIMKFTEGGFRKWGYELAAEEYGAVLSADNSSYVLTVEKTGQEIVIKDCIADAFLQNILIKPEEYDVIATLNLNGDYVSDTLAASVGGIGIAPGANINYSTGVALFEATHGTAPDIAGKGIANPSSFILSGEMLLRYIGWTEAADKILTAMERIFSKKRVTTDFYNLMEGAEKLSTGEFGEALAEEVKDS